MQLGPNHVSESLSRSAQAGLTAAGMASPARAVRESFLRALDEALSGAVGASSGGMASPVEPAAQPLPELSPSYKGEELALSRACVAAGAPTEMASDQPAAPARTDAAPLEAGPLGPPADRPQTASEGPEAGPPEQESSAPEPATQGESPHNPAPEEGDGEGVRDAVAPREHDAPEPALPGPAAATGEPAASEAQPAKTVREDRASDAEPPARPAPADAKDTGSAPERDGPGPDAARQAPAAGREVPVPRPPGQAEAPPADQGGRSVEVLEELRTTLRAHVEPGQDRPESASEAPAGKAGDAPRAPDELEVPAPGERRWQRASDDNDGQGAEGTRRAPAASASEVGQPLARAAARGEEAPPGEAVEGRLAPLAEQGAALKGAASWTDTSAEAGKGSRRQSAAFGADNAADEVAGWRHYVSRGLAPGPGTVRRAVQQAAARVRAQVVQEARYLHRNGRSEMTVRLHPPELGRMKVDVQMRDGRLEVRIRVENAEVRETLRSELTGLDRSLRDAQLDLARLEVSDYQAGSQERRDGLLNEWEAPGRGMQPSQSGADAAGPAGWAVFSESGGVDCLV